MEVVVSSAVLTTIFFGGYSLPFLHRNGITVAFGDTVLYEQRMAHLAVVLIGAATFFVKTVIVCWLQLFIRWTVPRFRYDQVMRLGWRKLLPAAIVNMMLTGVVLLALDQGGPGLSSALGLLGDLSQGLIVVVAGGLLIWFVAAMLKPVKHPDLVLSSSAKYAVKQGGVKTTPMQA
jgi:NADH-quinone oxidoreductase subunit H